MDEANNLKVDAGGVNARILAKEAKTDFRRIEGATVKITVRFASAEGKRFYVRFFHTLQLNAHFVSVIARTRLDHADVARAEESIRQQIDQVATALDAALDEVEALFRQHGISTPASYDTVPLDLEVHVLSSSGRRFLEVLAKLDQLMPLLQTLEIHEVVPAETLDLRRAGLKRQVRNAANGARTLATSLRRRMNHLVRREGAEDRVIRTVAEASVTSKGDDESAPSEVAEASAQTGDFTDPTAVGAVIAPIVESEATDAPDASGDVS